MKLVALTLWTTGSLLLGIGIAPAHGLQLDSGDNKTIYFNEAGKKLDAIEAFKRAMADEKILKCDYMEAVGNQRTGKVTLKKKK